MMFETSYIGNLSPATISRCSILNFAPDTVPWMNLYECWAKDAKTRWIINTAVYVCLTILLNLFTERKLFEIVKWK